MQLLYLKKLIKLKKRESEEKKMSGFNRLE